MQSGRVDSGCKAGQLDRCVFAVKGLVIELTDIDYVDAQKLADACHRSIETWCTEIIDAHIASHRLANQPELPIAQENYKRRIIEKKRQAQADSTNKGY